MDFPMHLICLMSLCSSSDVQNIQSTAGGLVTVMRLIFGRKIFFIGVRKPDWKGPYITKRDGYIAQAYHWQSVLVEPLDDM